LRFKDRACSSLCIARARTSVADMPSVFGLFVLLQAAAALRKRSAASKDEVAAERSPWHLNKIHRDQASFTGKGVHVYVVSSGVRVTHEEFGGRAINTIDTTIGGTDGHPDIPFCTPVVCTADFPECGSYSRLTATGTQMAGLVGGATYGVATEAMIHSVTVGGPLCHTRHALNWLAQNAQRPAVVVSGGRAYANEYEEVRSAFDAVVNSGIAVMVGAGSSSRDACLGDDAIIPSVIGVGSLTWRDEVRDRQHSRGGSDYGRCIDIWAPGMDLVTTTTNADDATGSTAGSKYSSALVAGAAALLLEENPSLAPDEVRSTLRGTATKDAISGQRDGDSNLLLNVGPLGATPAPGSECPAECNFFRCVSASCKVCHFC